MSIKSDKETRKIGKNLKPAEVKEKISKIRWKKDHRGIKYDKKSGTVTAT